jgi:uncharacterized protein (DUF1499 family)
MWTSPKARMVFLLLCWSAACNLAYASGEETGSEIRLKPCPSSPNCVSSLDSDDKHFIRPLIHSTTQKDAYQKLVRIIESEPQARIVARKANYIHVEFKSRIFGFIDDVEFFFPLDQPVIHARSASRKGYYDFGVNRRRIEAIRRSLGTSQIH